MMKTDFVYMMIV